MEFRIQLPGVFRALCARHVYMWSFFRVLAVRLKVELPFPVVMTRCICRILECEKQPGIAGGKVPVEIWDVSGDQA